MTNSKALKDLFQTNVGRTPSIEKNGLQTKEIAKEINKCLSKQI